MAAAHPPRPDRALLVGIDRYLPPASGAGGLLRYPSLSGAVRDALGMADLLSGVYQLPASRIATLLAPRDGPAPDRLPTYEEIVAALRRLLDAARPGEQILFFYSGHGGRAATAYPEIKGEKGLDEALVPWNIGDPTARYLRDVELAHLFTRAAERELYLTVVLDCCHSGGALRDLGDDELAAVREPGRPDLSARSAESAVAPQETLVETWSRLVDRDLAPRSGWVPVARGYVLLAACQAHERAFERPFDGRHTEGALSHFLLAALRETPRTTYRRLFERAFAGVRTSSPRQTPQLEGEGDRVVFGTDVEPGARGIPVLRVEPDERSRRGRPEPGRSGTPAPERPRRVLLATGTAQGVTTGARLAIETDAHGVGVGDRDLPIVEVTEAGATMSWAEPRGGVDLPAVGWGDRASVRSLASPCPVRWPEVRPFADEVRDLVRKRAAGLVAESDAPAFDVVIAPPGAAARPTGGAGGQGSGGRRPAEGSLKPVTGHRAPDHVDAPLSGGEIEIRDAAGRRLPNQGTPLAVDAPNAARTLVHRLAHLARYRALLALPGPGPEAYVERRLSVALKRLDAGGRPHDLTADSSGGGIAEVAEGTRLRLEVHHRMRQPAELVVLALRPGWRVDQIVPDVEEGRSGHLLDEGEDYSLGLTARPPEGFEPAPEHLLVFLTLGGLGYRWLEMPALEEPATQEERRADPGPHRADALEPEPVPARVWAVRKLAVRVVPG